MAKKQTAEQVEAEVLDDIRDALLRDARVPLPDLITPTLLEQCAEEHHLDSVAKQLHGDSLSAYQRAKWQQEKWYYGRTSRGGRKDFAAG